MDPGPAAGFSAKSGLPGCVQILSHIPRSALAHLTRHISYLHPATISPLHALNPRLFSRLARPGILPQPSRRRQSTRTWSLRGCRQLPRPATVTQPSAAHHIQTAISSFPALLAVSPSSLPSPPHLLLLLAASPSSFYSSSSDRSHKSALLHLASHAPPSHPNLPQPHTWLSLTHMHTHNDTHIHTYLPQPHTWLSLSHTDTQTHRHTDNTHKTHTHTHTHRHRHTQTHTNTYTHTHLPHPRTRRR